MTIVLPQRGVEAAALAILIERYPGLLTLPELIEAMTVEVRRPERAPEVGRAVAGLVEADLVVVRSGLLVPTPTAPEPRGLTMPT